MSRSIQPNDILPLGRAKRVLLKLLISQQTFIELSRKYFFFSYFKLAKFIRQIAFQYFPSGAQVLQLLSQPCSLILYVKLFVSPWVLFAFLLDAFIDIEPPVGLSRYGSDLLPLRNQQQQEFPFNESPQALCVRTGYKARQFHSFENKLYLLKTNQLFIREPVLLLVLMQPHFAPNRNQCAADGVN